MKLDHNKIPEDAKEIMQKLLDNNFDAFIVGGAVRDLILQEEPNDWDVFTNASGEEILKIFPEGKVIGGAERQEKILTVVVGDIEVSQYRKNGDRTEVGNDLRTHLSTCDLTINALALNIDGEVLDFCQGLFDLGVESGTEYTTGVKYIRAVGDPLKRITEDKLRMMRTTRFICKYERTMLVNPALRKVIESTDILDLPQERVREELIKILKYKNGIEKLCDLNIIQKIFPELKKLYIEGGSHHDEPVFQHCINAFETSCDVTDNTLLRFGCFMHDIGKGETITKEDGEIHFYNHDNVGASIVERIMQRLKFSTNEIKYVKTLVKLHMFGYKGKDNIKDKTYVKFFNTLKENNIPIMDYVILIYCDHQGNQKKKRIKFGDFIQTNYLYQNYLRLKTENKPFSVKDLAISGKDLIDNGVPEGKVIGEKLNQILEMVLDGKIKNNRAELMYLIK